MKILHLNTFSGGSTGKIARKLCLESLKNGDEVLFVFSRGNKISDVPNVKIYSKLNMYLDGILSRLFDNQGLNSKKQTRKIVEVIKRFNPDTIYLHNLHGYYLNYKILFKYLSSTNINIKWILHDCWSFTGHCAYYTYIKCNKWKNECKNCQQKKTYPRAFVDRSRRNYQLKKKYFTLINESHMSLITPSNWLANEVAHSFLNKYRVNVIHNEIDLSIFKHSDNNRFIFDNHLENKKIILGVANKWEERKGLKYFVNLDQKLSQEKYVIVLVGVDKKQQEFLKKNTNIICINHTNNQQELVDLYSQADLLFNPTLEENYPTVNLEAQRCGTFVLSFDTGGCRETDLGLGLFKLTDKGNFVDDILKFGGDEKQYE